MDMQLSVVLLIGILILCVFGSVDRILELMHVPKVLCVLMCAALLALNRFHIALCTEVTLHPACLVLAGTLTVVSLRSPARAARKAFFGTLIASLAMAAVQIWLPVSFEPGLFLGLLCIPLAVLLWRSPFCALACVSLAPLVCACLYHGYEFLQYGYTILNIGSPEYFDAQIVGILCVAAVVAVNERRRVRA